MELILIMDLDPVMYKNLKKRIIYYLIFWTKILSRGEQLETWTNTFWS